MEGIFICGHKRCFKSFLKKSDLESHIHESHADLFHPTKEKQDNKSDMLKVINPSLSHADAKHSIPADSSTAPAPPRTCFSPSANSQPHDLGKKFPSNQPNEHPPPKPPMSPPLSPQPENCQSEEPSLSLFFHQPCTKAQRSPCPPFQYPPFQRPPSPPPPPPAAEETEADCNHLDELALLEMALKDTPELTYGIPPGSSDEIRFCESYLRPSYMGLAGMRFRQMLLGQGVPEGQANQSNSQGRTVFFVGDYGRVRGLLPIQPPNMPPMDGKALKPLQCGSTLDNKDGKAVLAPEPRLLPPPPLPHFSQLPLLGNFAPSGHTGERDRVTGGQTKT